MFYCQVFVDALTTAPVHTRRALFGTLVDALGDASLAISSCLLLLDACSTTVKTKRPVRDVDLGAENMEFVHQICHLSGPRSQVETMVKHIQCCHRMSVILGHRSGELSQQAYVEAFDTLVGEGVNERGEKLLMVVPLEGEDSSASPSTKSFMSLDLSAVLASLGYGKSRKKARGEGTGVAVGLFLKYVLAFVRMHLLSRPFLMAAATAVPMGNPENEASVETDLQEAFLLLCEVGHTLVVSIKRRPCIVKILRGWKDLTPEGGMLKPSGGKEEINQHLIQQPLRRYVAVSKDIRKLKCDIPESILCTDAGSAVCRCGW